MCNLTVDIRVADPGRVDLDPTLQKKTKSGSDRQEFEFQKLTRIQIRPNIWSYVL